MQGDPYTLQEVLFNLCTNALNAMPNGGTLTLRSYALGRKDEDQMGSVAIDVSDTGVGIPRVNLERIFEPFFTTRADSGGTGLGLGLCRMLISEMGGRIEVRSALGQGTTFTVVLNRADGGRAAGQGKPRRRESRLKLETHGARGSWRADTTTSYGRKRASRLRRRLDRLRPNRPERSRVGVAVVIDQFQRAAAQQPAVLVDLLRTVADHAARHVLHHDRQRRDRRLPALVNRADVAAVAKPAENAHGHVERDHVLCSSR